jgi:perosamine synthetase
MIPQMIPWFDEQEKVALSNYMESGGFLTEFKQTQEFELQISKYTGAKHAIVVNNGTVSLWMMLMTLNIGPGDSVLVPNYTMIATANAIRATGAELIFCDVEIETLCIDIDEVESKIKSNTRAVFFVAANGRYPSYDVELLINICENKGIVFLEDAAQALGSFYQDGKHIGTKGLMGSFSFSVPKIITTGQGGAIITDDDNCANTLRKMKDFGRTGGGIDIHDSFGLNFKFTDLQATIGLVQMEKLPLRTRLKKEMYQRYQTGLEGVEQIKLFENNLGFTSPWFIDSLAENREELITYLKLREIGTRVMYPPINEQKTYSVLGHFPISKYIGAKGLWLPSFGQISTKEIDHVTTAIKEFYA